MQDFFDPVVAARTQQSEFLVLIDQNKLNDQQVKLFEFLLDILKKNSMYILINIIIKQVHFIVTMKTKILK